MTQINPTWPNHGDAAWDGPLVTGLDSIVSQVNLHDVNINALSNASGGGGTGFTASDNGDGTFTILGAGVTDNGDGTYTITG